MINLKVYDNSRLLFRAKADKIIFVSKKSFIRKLVEAVREYIRNGYQ